MELLGERNLMGDSISGLRCWQKSSLGPGMATASRKPGMADLATLKRERCFCGLSCRMVCEATGFPVSPATAMPGSCADAEAWPAAALLQRVRESVALMAHVERDQVRFAVSPYRICPLGAHIDHQGGTVMAMAVNKGVVLGFVPSQSSKIELRSGQYKGLVEFSVHEVPGRKPPCEGGQEENGWGDYARGAVVALEKSGYEITQGIVGFVEGSKGCAGGGISSSAAVGIAFLLALENANALVVSAAENVELDRLIENSYLGLRNGLLDQSAILLSRQNCLTVVNCRDRTHDIVHPRGWEKSVKQGFPYKFILAFSGLRHALASTPGYNTRVMECQEAADALLRAVGRTSAKPILSNVTAEEYAIHKSVLEGSLARRARHYFTESSRVRAGIKAWIAGDMVEFGRLMSESGSSSIDDYECGCEPLIQLREIVLKAAGVLGARFSGAGFRGCCVALVSANLAEDAAAFIKDMYSKAQPELAEHMDEDTAVLICESGSKAHILL